MKSKLMVGLKVWLILLLTSLILLPITILKILAIVINPNLMIGLWIITFIVAVFIYGWLFTKFKKWLYK